MGWCWGVRKWCDICVGFLGRGVGVSFNDTKTKNTSHSQSLSPLPNFGYWFLHVVSFQTKEKRVAPIALGQYRGEEGIAGVNQARVLVKGFKTIIASVNQLLQVGSCGVLINSDN